MLFSSLIFLFYFLPLVLLGNLLVPERFKNLFLLIASLIFFAWGGVSNTIVFIVSILINYFSGLLIARNEKNERKKKLVFIISIILNLGILCFYKYTLFFIENINVLLRLAQINEFTKPRMLLPIGISFYTFHGISYIFDVYRGTTKVQKKLSDLSLYISFFPQLIAGPIVRYKDVAEQLTKRNFNYEDINNGLNRFILGLGKKVLIANTLAVIADNVFNSYINEIDTTTAWLGIIAYSLQIYFDFSAYSDMAIGLALVFGFHFKENFNFPYLAESIKDFWRRWHISLSTWFRDYLYIPLGGNRKGNGRTYFNLIVVFFITGLWHGASWNFVAWGFVHGLFIILESLGLIVLLERAGKPARILYASLIVMFAWVLFRAATFEYALSFYKVLFGFGDHFELFKANFKSDFKTEQLIVFTIAILGALGGFNFYSKIEDKAKTNEVFSKRLTVLRFIFSLLVLAVCTIYLVSGSYNPFIYFRF